MSTLECKIVTPTSELSSGEASFVALPASEGEMGVFEKHEPVVTTLSAGTVRVTPAEGSDSGEVERFCVDGGYAQIDGAHVTVLADRAVALAGVDAAALASEIEALEARVTAAAEEGTAEDPLAADELAFKKFVQESL